MNRKIFIRTTALALGYTALQNQRVLAGLLHRSAEQISMLTDQIGLFTDKGGTILFYLGKEGNIVIDAQWPDQASVLVNEIKKRNNVKFDLLINTHHHLDNTSGNITFKNVAKHILAHENSKNNQMRNAKALKSDAKSVLPDLTYKDTWCEKFGKENVCLHYYGPAHTNGDSIIHFEYADVAHVGDLCFNRRHPGVDSAAGGNLRNWIEVLGKVYHDFGRKTRFVYSRSGDGYKVTGNKEDLKAFSTYLATLMDYTEREIKRGKTKKELLKVTSLPGMQEWKTGNMERLMAAAYDEITLAEITD